MRPPFIVWAEDGQDAALWAGNRMAEQTLGGGVHYFLWDRHCSTDLFLQM